MIWSRSDRSARMIVEWSTTEAFRDPRRVLGSHAIDATDFTACIDLRDLPRISMCSTACTSRAWQTEKLERARRSSVSHSACAES